MIRSFADAETERLFYTGTSRRFFSIKSAAVRKLLLLDSADRVDALREPPGNRLEALKGKRAGQYSIRVNDQYRICFRWHDNESYDVEVVDYH